LIYVKQKGGIDVRKYMKRILISLSCCALILSIAGCTSPTRISSDQVKEFRQEIQKEYPAIKNVGLEFVPTTMAVTP